MINKTRDCTIVMEPMKFLHYCAPMGVLDPTPECFGLWYYYVLARKVYEECIIDPIVLEGDKDPEYNFMGIFKSVAKLYGVAPEAMAKCWKQIDGQCWLLQYPKLPDEERYRFDRVIEIKGV